MAKKRSFCSRTGLLFVLLAIAFLLFHSVPLLMITDSAMDINIHDDYFVLPGGLYAAPMLICLVFAMLYALFTTITKKRLDARLGFYHWLASALALFGVYMLPMLALWSLLSSRNERRYISYGEFPVMENVIDIGNIATVLLVLGALGQALFIANIIRTSRRGPMLDNP